MKFKYIDIENWKRKHQYNHYLKDVPCTYSMTVKLEITKIIEKKRKIYPTMLYHLAKIVNKYDEFRMMLDSEGRLGYFEEIFPCYTIFHKESETFSNLWTEYTEEYEVFYERYIKDIEKYGSNQEMEAKPNTPMNTFPVSMIPWETFEGFNLNLQKEYNYLLPIFTLGKYYCDKGRYYIPLAIQVHHSVCDGFHLCRFIESLRKSLGE